jgi:hypothetical protein
MQEGGDIDRIRQRLDRTPVIRDQCWTDDCRQPGAPLPLANEHPCGSSFIEHWKKKSR